MLSFRPGWAPTIHIPFATLIRDLDSFCRMESTVPHEPRKRKRKRQDKSDEDDKVKVQKMEAKMREMETKGSKDGA